MTSRQVALIAKSANSSPESVMMLSGLATVASRRCYPPARGVKSPGLGLTQTTCAAGDLGIRVGVTSSVWGLAAFLFIPSAVTHSRTNSA